MAAPAPAFPWSHNTMNNLAQLTPHRGVIILVLGILSLILCQVLGPVAWVMGKGDMAQIDQGNMDPEGRQLTQAGMICGIIATIMLVLGLLAGLFFMVVFSMGAAGTMASMPY